MRGREAEDVAYEKQNGLIFQNMGSMPRDHEIKMKKK